MWFHNCERCRTLSEHKNYQTVIFVKFEKSIIMVTIIKKGTKKEEFDKKLSGLKLTKGFNSYKFCGILKLKEDPLSIQRRMRDEWE